MTHGKRFVRLLTFILSVLFMVATFVAAAAPPVSAGCPSQPANTPASLTWLAASLALSLSTPIAENERTHYVAYRALAERIVGRPIAQTEAMLELVLDRQKSRDDDNVAGFFTWTLADDDVTDLNSIEFVSLPLALLLGKYEGCFTLSFSVRLRAALALAAEGLAKDAARVTVGYTNIWIMNSLALAVIGETLGDTRWSNQGYGQLTALANLIRDSGISEYDSPTYYGVDVIALHGGYGVLRQKTLVQPILDYFWTDIAANFFAARGALSGPHGRDYDFLRGRGLLTDVPFITAGLISPVPAVKKVDLIYAMLWLGLVESPYALPTAATTALAMPSRVVTQYWHRPGQSNVGEQRYNFVTPDFALGSTSASYRPQDKTDKSIALNLAGSTELPSLIVIPGAIDENSGLVDDAYGLVLTASGKPTHLPFYPAVAQDQGLLLALAYSTPPTAGADRLVTNLVLPIPDAPGSVWVGGEQVIVDVAKVIAGQTVSKSVALGERIALRQRNTGIVLRVFAASGCNGQLPILTLQFEKTGAQKRAGRLIVQHVSKPPTPARGADCDMRVGFLLAVAQVDTDIKWQQLQDSVTTAVISEQIDPKVATLPNVRNWNASVSLVNGPFAGRTLFVKRTDEVVKIGQRIVRSITREANGQPMRFDVLGISAADPTRP